MQVAGIDITTIDAVKLIALLARDGRVATADTLATAWGKDETVVGLTIDERNDVLGVLDSPPDGLRQLRAVLLEGHLWRWREGI
jgi:hypothetical protein